MPITATATTHGAASFDALAAAVRRAQGDDRLAPVTVIVPTNTAGVMARRALGRRGGFANVDVLTLYRVAELLGARPLRAAGRQPVSTPIVDVAVRQSLEAAPGAFAAVADHPSTIVALRDLYREVRLAGPGPLRALAATERGAEPARLIADVAARLGRRWYDEGDLLASAVATVVTDGPGDRRRRLVVHGPERLRPLELELMRALAAAGEVELVVARTGDDDADEPVVDLVNELSGAVLPAPPSGLPTPGHPNGAVVVVSTTDADEEIRHAVRALLDAARSGGRFDRMALLWPSDRPYARLVEHHLGAAGVPWNGRPGTTVVERRVPRLLAELLDVDRRGLRRVPLMELLGDVPAVDAATGRLTPTARWERIARAAGVVRESDWATHLERWRHDLLARSDPDNPLLQRRLDDSVALGEFVAALRHDLGDRGAIRSWSDWVEWSHRRLRSWFGPAYDQLTGPEALARDQTDRVLERLRHLDDVEGGGGGVTRAEMRATFVAELDAVPARRGTLGEGVHVGSLAGARGLDLDLVIVVGAADGLLPAPPTVDPLLGDDDRRRAALATSDERARNARRQFLAVVDTTATVVITHPRGDLRATKENQRSRWVTPLVEERGYGETLLASHAHALAETEFPSSPAEHRRRRLWVAAHAGDDVRNHPAIVADPVAKRALALRDARSSVEFTVFDGDLSSRVIDFFDRAVAPTHLEGWVKCPHAFFVRQLLGVYPVEEPDDLMTLEPMDRGTAIHAAIDGLQLAVLAGELPTPGPGGWDEVHVAALADLLDAEAGRLELGGRTGRAAYWATERQQLVDETLEWIEHDRSVWSERSLRYSEQRFGVDELVTLVLADGRAIAFRGSIDRVDERPDGGLVVTDHKTGRSDPFRKLAGNPTLDGTHFQLPVYAAAARVLAGRPEAAVRAEYSFFRKGEFARLGVDFDAAAWERSVADLADVVEAIEAGVFIARPKEPGFDLWVDCHYCEPDGLGRAELWAAWQRKRLHPPLDTRFPAEATR